jgi:hypothetical protein
MNVCFLKIIFEVGGDGEVAALSHARDAEAC